MNEGRPHLSLEEESKQYQVYVSNILKEENWAKLQFLPQGLESVESRVQSCFFVTEQFCFNSVWTHLCPPHTHDHGCVHVHTHLYTHTRPGKSASPFNFQIKLDPEELITK